jgi:hypothetical protein
MDQNSSCICGAVKVGGKPTGSRNLNLDCPEHGTKSEWWSSPEQAAQRQQQSERLRDLQARAREARETARGV